MRDMISLFQGVQKNIRTWSGLLPKLALIGSVPEGTRLMEASELDMTVRFEGLKGKELIINVDNAMEMFLPKDQVDSHPLIAFCDKIEQGWKFNFPRFFIYFLREVQRALKDDSIWPNSLKKGLIRDNCQGCINLQKLRESGSPKIYCESCLPLVTHTKNWSLHSINFNI